jgi:hypothetical protein
MDKKLLMSCMRDFVLGMGWMEYHLPHYQNSNMVLRFFFLKLHLTKEKKSKIH